MTTTEFIIQWRWYNLLGLAETAEIMHSLPRETVSKKLNG